MTMLHRVFVYGTLKRGQPNHYWLTNDVNGLAEYVCEGVTNDSFPLVIGTRFNIPFLINLPKNGHCIVGEIYNVDDDMLNNLDKLEVYPTFYDRCKIDIYGTNGYICSVIEFIHLFFHSIFVSFTVPFIMHGHIF